MHSAIKHITQPPDKYNPINPYPLALLPHSDFNLGSTMSHNEHFQETFRDSSCFGFLSQPNFLGDYRGHIPYKYTNNSYMMVVVIYSFRYRILG